MRALVQRVTEARVSVTHPENRREDSSEESSRRDRHDVVGEIGAGLCVLIGVTHDDGPAEAKKLAAKVANLRVFDDEAGTMNRSLLDTAAAALVVSQFTLYGDTARGRRPSWVAAARPQRAEPLVDEFVDALRALGVPVATGRFRAEMQVALVNDGPVTLLLEVP